MSATGKRVKKKTFDSTTGAETVCVIFVYSGGKLVAEYSTKPPPQNPTTKYVATDTLQSVCAITNQDGDVISRRDFLPFGKEIPNSSLPGHSSSLRTSALKYGADDVRQKFTGYQKDEESRFFFAALWSRSHRLPPTVPIDCEWICGSGCSQCRPQLPSTLLTATPDFVNSVNSASSVNFSIHASFIWFAGLKRKFLSWAPVVRYYQNNVLEVIVPIL